MTRERNRKERALNIMLKHRLFDRLDARARDLGVSRPELVRMALIHECERVESLEAQRLRLMDVETERKALADGSRYEGGWRDGVPHGHGTYILPDGDRIEARFVDGSPYGPGSYTRPGGVRVEGTFRGGRYPVGTVEIIHPDGRRGSGHFGGFGASTPGVLEVLEGLGDKQGAVPASKPVSAEEEERRPQGQDTPLGGP